MDARVKTQWLAALRSGEYDQRYWQLRFGGEYCCLGVLCDLHAKETGSEWGSLADDDDSYLDSTGSLPAEVITWSGLEDADPEIGEDEYAHPTTASDWNDSFQKTFTEIADLIERHL